MKDRDVIIRRGLVAAALIALPGVHTHAQDIQFISASKGHVELQQDAAGSTISTLWFAELAVDGPESLSPPHVAGPIDVPAENHNGGFLGWNEEWMEWNYGAPNFDGWGVASKAELDALFGDGTYTFSGDGPWSVPVTLAGDDYPVDAPVLSLENGHWVNGIYLLDPRADVVRATTAPWSEYGTGVLEVVSIQSLVNNYAAESWSSDGDPGVVTLEVSTRGFAPGESMALQSTFAKVVDITPSIPELPGAVAAGLYLSLVNVQIQVAPFEDLDLDGSVGAAELGALLVEWGPCTVDCIADLDGDGAVGPSDLAAILVAWGDYL